MTASPEPPTPPIPPTPHRTPTAAGHAHAMALRRGVRFCITPDPDPRGHNTFAGHPTMSGLGAYYELEVTVLGRPDPLTGYLINIRDIDRAVRERAVAPIAAALRESFINNIPADPALILRDIAPLIQQALPAVITRIMWRLTPFYTVTLVTSDPDTIIIRQQYEFAAAHRLHVPSMSDEQNRAVFGKCNNPSGHGHNYRLEVAVRTPLTDSGAALSLIDLERIVSDRVIDRFDHTHLNTDTAEFAADGGSIPSVEHIARTCYDLLLPELNTSQQKLIEVTIWETEKTSCTYPG